MHQTAPAPGATTCVARPTVPPFQQLAAALCDHVRRIVVVPGKPVHLLADHLPVGRTVEVTDEKSGFEQAMGMAVAGLASATLYKGLGVSHAWDSITNAVVHGTVDGGPVLIVAADDTTAEASTVIVDSRALAATIDLAVVEPCTADHVTDALALAASLSTTVGEPVMVRYTPDLAHLDDAAEEPGGRARPTLAGPRVVPMPGLHRAHGMTKPGRHLHRHRFSVPVLTALVDGADLLDEHRGATVLPDHGRTAVIGFGSSWSTVGRPLAEELDLHGMGSSVVSPLPGRLVELASRFDTVLVVEDGRPVGEEALILALHDIGARTRVLGRRCGALPPVGRLEVGDGRRALGNEPVEDRVPLWKEAGKQVEAPYGALFDAVSDLRRRHALGVATCVGTVIDVAGAPWHGVDLALSLGSAPAAAAGMAEGGRRAVAMIGDYGLLHSGLNAYGEIQRRRLPVLSVIVANGVSKRTGGQHSAFHPDERGAVDLLAELSVRGARQVRVVDGDTADADSLGTVLEEALAELPATVIVESGVGFHRPSGGEREARPSGGEAVR